MKVLINDRADEGTYYQVGTVQKRDKHELGATTYSWPGTTTVRGES